MKLDFARKSEEPTREQLVGAIELTDEELARVAGGHGGDGERGRERERERERERGRHEFKHRR